MIYKQKNRLKNHDYSQDGYYFITICTKDRIESFGKIENEKMQLNSLGEILKKQWLWLKEQYPYVFLDEYVVMPNHFHGILIIDSSNSTGINRSQLLQNIKILPLSNIISAFKMTSSKLIHEAGYNNFTWQKSYYDHIIRNEKSLYQIQKYIQENPLKWVLEKNNPENLYM